MPYTPVDARDLAEPRSERSIARQMLIDAVGDGFDQDRERVLELIDAHPDIADRTCRPGHLTGSAFVVDPSRDVCLLLFHTKLQRWLQPGGHADGDTNLARVAWREATEETGIEGLVVVAPAIDVDIHRVDPPKEDAHLHLDVRYLVIAPPGAEAVGNHESQGFRWVGLAEFGDYDLDEGHHRMARTGFAAAAAVML
jgi:8-oxo-dGTP pyrophosphatase MutT (NUDIX family)